MNCGVTVSAWLFFGLFSGAFLATIAPVLTKRQLGIDWQTAGYIERLAVIGMAIGLGPSILILEWRMVGLLLRAQAQINRGRLLRRIAEFASEAMVAGMTTKEREAFNARLWNHMRSKRNYEAMSLRDQETLEQTFFRITNTCTIPNEQCINEAMQEPQKKHRFSLRRIVVTKAFAMPVLANAVLKR